MYYLLFRFMNLAEKIKTEMRKKKFTTAELSALTGISQMTAQNILQGRSKKIEYIQKIALALNVPLDYLINEELVTAPAIDLKKYIKASKISADVLTQANLNPNKRYLEEFIFMIYQYIVSSPEASDASYIAYAQGLMQRDLNHIAKSL